MSATVLLSSCVKVNDVCPPDSTGEYTLNLNVGAGSIASRATGHTTEQGIDAESFINIGADDYMIYILDADGCLVQPFIPSKHEITAERYTISGKFYPSTEKFRVMVLANWKTGFGGSYTENINLDRTKLNDLYKDELNFNFDFQNVTAKNDSKLVSWIPEEDSKGIPMFGVSKELEITPGINASTIEIPMLRALVKIQINNLTPDYEQAEIVECKLTNILRLGRFIPDGINNPQWTEENVQVTSTSLPQGNAELQDVFFAKVTDMSSGKSVFTAYIPEMKFDGMTKRPTMEIKMNIGGKEMTRSIEFANYNKSVVKDKWEHLLRNHQYTFNITSVGIDAGLDIIAQQWEVYAEQTWTYEDATPKFAEDGEFKFTKANFEIPADAEEDRGNEIQEDLEVKSLTVIVTPDDGAEGEFRLESPSNGLWTLALYGEGSTPADAFVINLWDTDKDDWEDGDGSDSRTSFITGDKVKFKIIAKHANYSGTPYTARLVMTTATEDGRIVEVDVTPAELEGHYYTLKQFSSQ